MWWSSDQDPGGSSEVEGSKETPPNQEDMKERYEQQQILLAQLKEMLKKSEQTSSVSKEKVEEYASTLSEINARAKLGKIRRSEGKKQNVDDSNKLSSSSGSKKVTVSTPTKEKINLLRQQLEENRAKLAQRDKNQKDIEEMFYQLKAQLDDPQVLISDSSKTEINLLASNFSIESSKDDLLNAIKCKDDHIAELTMKMQHLQANVLDLQENIKEKDSVIDARTKAITLLSENLSKKGKNTLDLLDETKEQMRNMQQNFVELETNMKEENVKLTLDIEEKNKKIEELLKCNSSLELKLTNTNEQLEKYKLDLFESEKKVGELEEKLLSKPENSTPQKTSGKTKRKNKKHTTSVETDTVDACTIHLTKIAELEVLVDELKQKVDKADDNTVTKLNKQLEEMNKNMIKMKAQHKAKLKELQNKVSMDDTDNGKVTHLEMENTKLSQCIAELEDEKGNLQLRLMEIESNKEKEYIADLENKIEEQKMEIENHIRTITCLELQITSTSNEISSLRGELSNLMHLENVQVCSEMTSVQLEEQLDKEMSQKKEIQDKYNVIVKENENLLDKIDLLNKEKQELLTKLDNYMQENMELIDRLEKLSTEKVSSAESIEIVESLTQQEKLELEAYQKNMVATFETDKSLPIPSTSSPSLLLPPPPPSSSSSIIMTTKTITTDETDDHLQLEFDESKTKEELLERIELFTIERREVLDKMDHLQLENQHLISKLEQLEKELDSDRNNRNENEDKLLIEYRAIIENQKIQITSLQEELWNKSDQEEKDEDNFSNNRSELEEEINCLKQTINDNKMELVQAAENITKKNLEIDKLNNELFELMGKYDKLNTEIIEQEQRKQDEILFYSNELEQFKMQMTNYLKQLENYENEIQHNTDTINLLNDQLEELNFKITKYEHDVETKTNEISILNNCKCELEKQIASLQVELNEKNASFKMSCDQLIEKCKYLENQIATNSESIEDIKIPFEMKIKELETKNKEHVDKMKKIAANLKRKTITCQELETQLVTIKEKWENENKEKDEKQKLFIEQQQVKFETITKELNAKVDELHLKTELIDQMTIERNAQLVKLKEKDLFIENLENDIQKYKDRIQRLEEILSNLDERESNLKIQLEDEKQNVATANAAAAAAAIENRHFDDLLEKRLSSLMAHDEIIEKKLQHTMQENTMLHENLKHTVIENERLKEYIADIEVKLNDAKIKLEKLHDLDNEYVELKNINSNLESDLRKIQIENEQKLNEKIQEIEQIETELNQQLDQLHNERKLLLNKCELLEDQLKEHTDNELLLNEEIANIQKQLSETKQYVDDKQFECDELINKNSNYLLRIEQLEKEQLQMTDNFNVNNNFDELKQQHELKVNEIEHLVESNKNYLLKIEQLENELLVNENKLDAKSNEFQTELNYFKQLLNEKDINIENYQKQNMQLQMAVSFGNQPEIIPSNELNQIQIELKQNIEEKNQLQKLYENTLEKLNNQIQQQHENNDNEKLSVKKTDEEKLFELKEKIKTLQFMLFNMEKEKDDILSQCQEMANELTRLIFEREKYIKQINKIETYSSENSKDINLEILASNIIQQQQIDDNDNDDNKQLEEIEFTPVTHRNITQSSLTEPVIEDVIKPTKAYLCYNTDDEDDGVIDNDQKKQQQQHYHQNKSIESEIISVQDTKITPEDKKMFEKIEYGHVNMPRSTSTEQHKVPVNETIDEPKSSYLCYPTTSTEKITKNVDTFASEEDGWGWNAEEAKLEAEHYQQQYYDTALTESQPVSSSLYLKKIEQLEERIHDLELEKSRLLDDVKNHQIRSGKLIKKIKLMKENYEKSLATTINTTTTATPPSTSATAKSSLTDDFNLDMAIQDELNNQIKILEKRCKEINEEHSKEKLEKENLIKRLDVLQSANDRMIDIKEKTDNEMQFLQFKNRELSEKLHQLEQWNFDSSSDKITETTVNLFDDASNTVTELNNCKQQLQELQKQNTDLILDNEELQLLLEEQKNKRTEIEKLLSNATIANADAVSHSMSASENMKTVQIDNENLKQQLTQLEQVKQQLNEEKQQLLDKANQLQIKFDNVIDEKNTLIVQLEYNNVELEKQLFNIKQQQQEEIYQFNETINQLRHEKENLTILFDEKRLELDNQLKEISELNEQILILKNEIQQTLSENQQSKIKIQELECENGTLNNRLQEILIIQRTTDQSNDDKLREINEQLTSSLAELEIKYKQLSDQNNILTVEKSESDQNMSVTIQQLTDEWSKKVDQRGNDVAESWKLHLETIENEFSQKENRLKTELNEIFQNNEQIIAQNNELQKQVESLICEKQNFITKNNDIIETLQKSSNDKQIEIIELTEKLREITIDLEQKTIEISTLKPTLELMELKEMKLQEIAMELELKTAECLDFEEKLKIKETMCQELHDKLNEMSTLSIDETTNQISDLRDMIENQVLKIEKLKIDLENKNTEYNSLLTEFENMERIYLKGTQQQQQTHSEQLQNVVNTENPSDPVNRAELDLALYMLHQRDVRCEELTVELMQLLEERDTLQLKLSNAIRLNEELRMKINNNLTVSAAAASSSTTTTTVATGADSISKKTVNISAGGSGIVHSATSTGAIPKSKAIILGATGTELATEAIENIPPTDNTDKMYDLNDKISLLRSVGYRDKTLKDDQEIRHLQQMSIMQQHRDLASKLPPEAAARLVDANYTLSRDVQSPSKVLLNWLWGRSTPKVNDV